MTEDQANTAVPIVTLVASLRSSLANIQAALAESRVIRTIDIALDDGTGMHWNAQALPPQVSTELLTHAQAQFQAILDGLLAQLAAL